MNVMTIAGFGTFASVPVQSNHRTRDLGQWTEKRSRFFRSSKWHRNLGLDSCRNARHREAAGLKSLADHHCGAGRLSFAVSTAFQPEVILLDEWLGTGDLEFRDKAARRLRQIIQDSRIFVFATHSRDLHRRMSNKGAVMDKGQILFCGELEEAFEFQDKLVADKAAAAAAP